MKKNLFILLILILSCSTGFSQKDKHEKIKTLKTAFITDKVDFNQKQAEEFWPVYNEYDKQRWANYREQRHLNRGPKDGSTLTENQIKEDQEKVLVLKQQSVDLDKKYRVKLLKIISAKQFQDLINAEREFHDMLMEKLKKSRH